MTWTQYPRSFLLQLFFQFFNEGLMVTRVMVAKNIFVNYLGASLNQSSAYNSIVQSPWLFKMFFGIIVDSRVVTKRKYYLVVSGLLATFSQVYVSLGVITEHQNLCALLTLYNVFASILDVTIESIAV